MVRGDGVRLAVRTGRKKDLWRRQRGPSFYCTFQDFIPLGGERCQLGEAKPVVDYRYGQKEVSMLGSEEEVSAFRKDWERECSAYKQRQTVVRR